MFNPSRVDLIRRRLGHTKIAMAEKLGVDRKTIQRFEAGTADLPEHSKKKLIELSGYPEAFFSRPPPEYPNSGAVSFRSLRSLTASARDKALAIGAIAFEFDDWICQRYDLPAHTLLPERVTVRSPIAAAMELRATWGIGVRPIGNMINLLEAHGVRVFSLAEETRHLDAYSLWRNNKPYVFLNTKKTSERSRFDAAHELGHLLMHRHTGSNHPSAETEADMFAAAFLMPEDDVRSQIMVVRGLRDIIEKKRRWGVSAAALSYNLNKLGKISDWHYRGYCIELGKYEQGTEPNPMPRETSQVWAKILTDLWRQGFSLSRVADNLHVPECVLRELLFGITSDPATQIKPAPLRALNSKIA